MSSTGRAFMTFEEFQRTGVYVESLDDSEAAAGSFEDTDKPGRVYVDDQCYIESEAEWEGHDHWSVTIENGGCIGTLEQCERELYGWACGQLFDAE